MLASIREPLNTRDPDRHVSAFAEFRTDEFQTSVAIHGISGN